MDSTLPAPETSANTDIPVKVDTLSLDGVAPDVGDQVEFSVKGTVAKVLNGTAFVTPDSVNDVPVEDSKPEDVSADESDPRALAAVSGDYGY